MIDVHNPTTGELIDRVETVDIDGARAALGRARDAEAMWAATPVRERARVILRFRDQVVQHAEDLARLLARENGKVLQEAIEMEILPVADLATWFAGRAEEVLAPQPLPLHLLKHRTSTLLYKPRGVVLVIGPWNFPLTIPAGSVIMALLAGNTVIFKPASLTPLIALELGRLFDKAGLPPGVLQVLPCAGRVASELIDEGVDYVNFTGSTEVGKIVAERCARNLIPYSMELGGKDPAVILPDAPIEYTARGLVWGAFGNAGQVCASVERAYVHESIWEPLVDAVVRHTQALQVGDPMKGGTDMGPMTDPGQLDIVASQVAEAVQAGARLLTGGRRPPGPGQFFEPTVIVDVTDNMRLMREEIFGPVLPLIKVSDTDEAVRRANDSEFGLNAYVFTKDRGEGRRVAERLEAGTVMVNEVLLTHAAPETPWGGIKTSGVGRVHGDEGLRDLCEVHHINEEQSGVPRVASPFWHPYSAARFNRLVGSMRLLWGHGPRAKAQGLWSALRGR